MSEYAAFVSHRGGVRALVDTAERFREGLEYQLELLTRKSRVYVDQDRLMAGDHFDQALATALCQSYCMVVLFDPDYFHLQHRYCAREYWAMCQLETQRLQAAATRQRGLIIPVVIRGETKLPAEIKNARHFVSFEREMLVADDFSTTLCRQKLREIANAIKARIDDLGDLDCSACDTFNFPAEDDNAFSAWLQQVVTPVHAAAPMPGSAMP